MPPLFLSLSVVWGFRASAVDSFPFVLNTDPLWFRLPPPSRLKPSGGGAAFLLRFLLPDPPVRVAAEAGPQPQPATPNRPSLSLLPSSSSADGLSHVARSHNLRPPFLYFSISVSSPCSSFPIVAQPQSQVPARGRVLLYFTNRWPQPFPPRGALSSQSLLLRESATSRGSTYLHGSWFEASNLHNRSSSKLNICLY